MNTKRNLNFYVSFTIAILVSIGHETSWSQGLEYRENPKLTVISNPSWADKRAVIVDESIRRRFTLSENGKDITVRFYFHKIVQVLNDDGIEQFNKVKISYNPKNPIENLKARTVLANGTVKELDKNDFKTQKEEDGSNVLLFAFEGVDKGAEVEFYYECNNFFNYFASYRMQDELPTLYSSYEVVSPSHIKVEPKIYGEIALVTDTVLGEERIFKVESKNLDGIEDEPMAHIAGKFARLEYKIAYNLNNPGKRLFSWQEFAKTQGGKYYDFSEKEIDAVSKILKQDAYKALESEESKIIWIENHVKSNYFAKEDVNDEEAWTIPFIMKNKYTTVSGMQRFIACVYQAAGIKFSVGFTTSRNEKAFDYDWDNWDNLDNMLMYFPSTKKYLAPVAVLYRYPLVPALWTLQDALFIKTIKLGDAVSYVPEKKYVDMSSYEANYHNHVIDLAMNETMDTVIVNSSTTLKGQNAIPLLPAFVFAEKEDAEKTVKEIFKMMEKDDLITDVSWENSELASLSSDKPLALKAKIHSTNILEKAGSKFLVKIGFVIGRQSELYEKKERKFDADMNEPHQLLRDIVFTIPAGYKVNNLSDINIDKSAKVDGNEVCYFRSTHRVEDNKVIIRIEEVYKQAVYPKSIFEEFRSVINAAADFNKVSLVLEKI